MMRVQRYVTRLVLVAAVAGLAMGWRLPAFGAENGNGKAAGPTVEAVYVETAPVIDGELDDACWDGAARAEGFYAAQWDAASPEETIGLVCVGEKAIYVGFVCNDRSPKDITAKETRRNGDMAEDDYVQFGLDPNDQHKNWYWFKVNARGTQAEYIPGGSATKIEWRGDWQAAAKRTETGWQAEMAIPFSSISCPPGQTVFAFSLTRHFAKERLDTAWPNMGPTDDMTRSAHLAGLRQREKPRRTVWLPYVTADFGDTEDEGVDAGLDVQHKMDNGLTGLAVWNPDFKQIEDVVEPISFSYTERYLQDPRPFFVTGQNNFLPREHLFYTRRIEDFDAGIKVFGKVGKETIGILDAVSFGEQNALAAQWRHEFDEDNWLRLGGVSGRADGLADNLATEVSAGHTWRRPEGTDSMWMVLYDARTEGEGSGSSYAIGGSRFRGYGKIECQWELRRVTPDFHPALGYYTDVNNVGGNLNLQQIDFYEKGPIEARQWKLGFSHFPYLEGDGIYQSSAMASYFVRTRSTQLYGLQVTQGKKYDYDDSGVMGIVGWKNTDVYRSGELNMVRGKRAGGSYTYYKLDQRMRPMEGLSLRAEGEYVHLRLPGDVGIHQYQAVMTTSYDITAEKCVSARGIWRDDGFSAYLAYRQVVRQGMDAYVIVGDPDPSQTGFTNRVVVKLIWAL